MNSLFQKAPKRLPAELLESLSEQPPSKLVRRPDGSKGRVSESAVSSEEQKKLELKKARVLGMFFFEVYSYLFYDFI